MDAMGSAIDYTKLSEAELVDMFSRTDPRFAPDECARLGELLTKLGYIVTQGETGPGSVKPSASKLQMLIGSSHPKEFNVEFGKGGPLINYLSRTHNDFGFIGSGTLRTDGIYVYLSGQLARRPYLVSSGPRREEQIPNQRIANVEVQGQFVRFEYDPDELEHGSMTVQLDSNSAAAALVALLPTTRTKDFRPQIEANFKFEDRLLARSARPVVTYGLVAINTLVFIGSVFFGAELFRPTGDMQIAWGSNFGPYTTDDEWWRLITSLFIHFGLLHVLFNMLALAWFGPLVERLYGGAVYLLIYLFAGILGSVVSIGWHPALNSAGASGAIFGVCGALLAQLLFRSGVPSDVSRPIRRSTLIFIGWSAYATFGHKGVDYAAHLGGLAAGCILGLAATLPMRNEQSNTRQKFLPPLVVVAIAVSLSAVGVYWAKQSAASLVGDALYYHTVRWMRTEEHGVNAKLNAAMTRARQDPTLLVETLERIVLPFWREAQNRLGQIKLPIDSPNNSTLNTLREIADGRARGFQLLDDGLQRRDPKEIAAAKKELNQFDYLAESKLAPIQNDRNPDAPSQSN
jgi:rhomboid protease GluP